MEILLTRTTFTELSTIGKLLISSIPFNCVTIENTDRNITQNTPVQDILRIKALHPKEGEPTASDVAIPTGRYEVAMTWSNRFAKVMPQILNVPGFDGIRIHIGSIPKDIIGCIAVAEKVVAPDFINGSVKTFNILYPILQEACAKEKVYITIQSQNQPA